MTHREENIENHFAGDSRIIKTQIREQSDNDEEEFGDPINVEDASFTYRFSDSESGGDCEFTKTVDSGIEVVEGSEGRIEIEYEPEDTENLEEGEYFHNLEMEREGRISTVFTGTVEVIETLRC